MGKRVLAAFGVAAAMDGYRQAVAEGGLLVLFTAAAAAPAVSRRSPCPASPPGWPGRRPASLLKNAPYQAAVKLYLGRLLSRDAQERAIAPARTSPRPPAARASSTTPP